MPLEVLAPLVIFAGALVCTPGPANILLMASGARFGYSASLPLVCGVTLGKFFIHAGLAAGLWRAVEEFPDILLWLKIIGAAYILHLAWKMLSSPVGESNTRRPLSFVSGLAVHPLNPKAWVMVVSAYGQFIDAGGDWWIQTFVIFAVFFFWQCVAHNFWCWGGANIARKIYDNRARRRLMFFLAATMVAAVAWSLFIPRG